MSANPIRILQLVSSPNPSSGVRTVVTNWHNHMDTSKVQFDYLYVGDEIVNQDDITRLGAKFYVLPNPYKHPVQFLRESYRFFKTHRYKTIHSHFTNLNLFFFPLAKMFGVKNIIQHSHLNKWSENKLSGLRNYLMLHAVWPLITHKMACSQEAGKVYFGKNFTVVNNGINVEKFTFQPDVRTIKRKELGVENNFVIGHIGRLSVQKNHIFLLDIFEQIIKKEPSAKLVLVGNGPLEKQIKTLVTTKNLQNNVLFLGVRKDVAELYQAFDCFVFPSLYEGLGIVAVEAQAAGLPCVLADTVPPEAFICNYKKLPLGSADQWAQATLAWNKNYKRTDTSAFIKTAGFEIKEIARQMQNFYEELER